MLGPRIKIKSVLMKYIEYIFFLILFLRQYGIINNYENKLNLFNISCFRRHFEFFFQYGTCNWLYIKEL